jgi:hypothetical protein
MTTLLYIGQSGEFGSYNTIVIAEDIEDVTSFVHAVLSVDGDAETEIHMPIDGSKINTLFTQGLITGDSGTRQFTVNATDDGEYFVVGAEVQVDGEIVGETDEEGQLIVRVTKESFDYQISKDGYNTVATTIPPGESDVVVRPVMNNMQRKVYIDIIDGDGAALNDTDVYVNGMTWHLHGINQFNVSQSNLVDLEFNITKDGYTSRYFRIERGTSDITGDIILYILRNCLFNVTDNGLEPLSGVDVKVDGMSKGETDVNGEISFDATSAEFEIEFSKTGYETQTGTVPAGKDDIEATIDLIPIS